MRLKLLPLLLALCGTVPSVARDFTYTYEGQTITYTVLDEAAKTCTVKDGGYSAGDNVLVNLVLPEHPMDEDKEFTLTEIGQYAFYNCCDLESVIIPNSVTSIGESAFSWCISLENFVIPNSVVSIGDYAFCNTSLLSSIEFPNTVTSIGVEAFRATDITSVVIPNSVTSIGDGAFTCCHDLLAINVEEDNPNYSSKDGVLFNRDQTMLIQCPGGKIDTYTISNSVTSIRNNAFDGCRNLTSIEIPASVTEIGENAFSGCDSLTSITIPSSITEISYGTFSCCYGLTNIEIPESVTEIKPYAFFCCYSLTSVIIPKSVAIIRSSAFCSCYNLTSVTCLSITPPSLVTDWDNPFPIFEDNNATLYVPVGSLPAYNNSDWTRYFTNIERLPSNLKVEISGEGKVYPNGFNAVISGTEFTSTVFEFFVLPNDGNVVASIILNDQDVLDRLVNHRLYFDDILEDGLLNIEFAPEADATLVVKGADTHAIRHTYKEGTSAIVELQPEDGWRIHSVTYNGEDIIDKLDNNVFTTKPLHGENNLNMVLVSDSSVEIESVVVDSQVRISVNRDTVSIIGLDDVEPVSVYDLTGKTIYTGFDRSLTLKSGEAYILTTPSKTFKVAL